MCTKNISMSGCQVLINNLAYCIMVRHGIPWISLHYCLNCCHVVDHLVSGLYPGYATSETDNDDDPSHLNVNGSSNVNSKQTDLCWRMLLTYS